MWFEALTHACMQVRTGGARYFMKRSPISSLSLPRPASITCGWTRSRMRNPGHSTAHGRDQFVLATRCGPFASALSRTDTSLCGTVFKILFSINKGSSNHVSSPAFRMGRQRDIYIYLDLAKRFHGGQMGKSACLSTAKPRWDTHITQTTALRQRSITGGCLCKYYYLRNIPDDSRIYATGLTSLGIGLRAKSVHASIAMFIFGRSYIQRAEKLHPSTLHQKAWQPINDLRFSGAYFFFLCAPSRSRGCTRM